MWWAVAIAGGVLLAFELYLRLVFGSAARGVYSGVPTLRPRVLEDEERTHAPADRFTVTTADGLHIASRVYVATEEPCATIIFAPEAGAVGETALHYAAPLLQSGFRIVALDFRNTGESEREAGYESHHWPTDREVKDVAAVLEHEAAAGHAIGFLGVSKGGAAGAIAAVDVTEVAAVALVSSFDTHAVTRTFGLKWAFRVLPRWIDRLLPTWHVAGTIRLGGLWEAYARGVSYPSLRAALAKLTTRAVFIVSGARDSYIPLAMAKSLAAAAGVSETSERLWLVPGAKHNRAREAQPAEYDRRLVAFFRDALGSTTKSPHFTATPSTESYPELTPTTSRDAGPPVMQGGRGVAP